MENFVLLVMMFGIGFIIGHSKAMRDYIAIGNTPVEEDCTQVGSPDYEAKATIECKAYINQLRRVFGNEPPGAKLTVKSFPHDFGTYHEVICYFEDEISQEYALKLEANSLRDWDDIARKELENVL